MMTAAWHLAWIVPALTDLFVLLLLGRTTREPERRDEGGQQ